LIDRWLPQFYIRPAAWFVTLPLSETTSIAPDEQRATSVLSC